MDSQAATTAVSVTAALELARGRLEGINLSIVGEVSELSDRPSYKAVYFTISDESSALPCVVWRNVYSRQGIELRQGMLVEVSGRFTLYAAKGRMNFDVRSIKPVGEGALRMRVAALAERLKAEGLMADSRKQPIPRMPERIGLVTSPHGKAVHDVLRTLLRRWPVAEVLLAGVQVEGEAAVEQMLQGLRAVQAAGPDVILLVRGGGSYEDLMPFNDERLARAVFASPIPVVTGIGHEPDNSIVDMVSDHRASTPTAAAERVSPDRAELAAWLADAAGSIDARLLSYFSRLDEAIARQAAHPLMHDPSHLLRGRWLALEHAQQRLGLAADGLARPYQADIGRLAAQLEALSPLSVLARGYALVTGPAGRLLRSVSDAALGDEVEIRLADGLLKAEVSAASPSAAAAPAGAGAPASAAGAADPPAPPADPPAPPAAPPAADL
jgi:exodeoxyribonuclease VII large subunit